MVKKNLLFLVLAFLLAVLCSPSSEVYAQKKVELTIAIHVEPSNYCFMIAERVKKTVEQKTQGRIAVRILGQEVGSERDQLEGCSRGEYHITLGGSMPLSLYAPKFGAPDLPFVYPDTSATRKLYTGNLGKLMDESIIKNGNMRLIGLSARNPRNLTASKPIKTLEDLKGLKIRVPQIMPWVRVWKELGTLPTPVAFPEVYSGLQTGLIEAQENPVDTLWNAKIYEVQKYLMLTNHVYSYFHWLMNDKFYQSLSEGDRKMIIEAVEAETKWGEEFVKGGEKDLTEKLQKAGMQLITPDVNAFRKKAVPAIRDLAKEYPPEVAAYLNSFLKD